ncbi:MAG: hypothetical protein FH756_00540 [Firmicutes bacterium]|nr:hypothetical protein [Bacillota bacterium]
MEKEVISKEIQRLRDLLTQTIDQMDQITKFYTYIDKLDGIERAELIELIRMCEGNGLDDATRLERKVKYLLKPRSEGKLQEQSNGRYTVVSGSKSFELTCGCAIDLFIPDQDHEDYGWQFGRVEHSDKYGGYYFYNLSGWDHHALRHGMTAAVRF